MKAHLLSEHQDFDFDAGLPAHADDLIQDLALAPVLQAMAAGDKFLLDVAAKVLLTSLTEVEAIRYRQDILADCLAQPDTVRAMYAIAVGALTDKRGVWGFLSSQNPTSILSGAVSQLEVLIVRLRQLRQLADDHAASFSSAGLSTLLRTLQAELDDEYFEILSGHMKQLRFKGGELLSAQLHKDNSGINYVLRSGSGRRGWKERVGLEPRSAYSFTIPPRDEAGAQAVQDIANRGVNLVANAAAQAADHVSGFFTRLRAELGFYVACLNLRDQFASRDVPVAIPEPKPWAALEFACTDLRDASLALRTGGVVGNDVSADGKALVIITGANSGGKSTFLRSVGQAQLMLQCGLFVTAGGLRTSVGRQIFTHFIRAW
jgi:MutS domain V